MKQIKEMLEAFAKVNQRGDKTFARLLDEIEDKENSASPNDSYIDVGLKEFVRKEKAELKEL